MDRKLHSTIFNGVLLSTGLEEGCKNCAVSVECFWCGIDFALVIHNICRNCPRMVFDGVLVLGEGCKNCVFCGRIFVVFNLQLQFAFLRGCAVGCARAVRKVGYFRPVFPDGQGDSGDYRVPIHRITEILTQSKDSDNELKQSILHTANGRLLSEPAVFALWTYASPVDICFSRVVAGKLIYHWVLCARCAETPP